MDLDLDVDKILSSQPKLEVQDETALTAEQQRVLNDHKVEVRLQNEVYMRDHPEISVMLKSFVRRVLLERPQDIKVFAAKYFTDPQLEKEIWESLKSK